MMLFEELVQQHRVHRFVAYGVNLSLGVASHQIGVHLFHLLSDKTELWDALGIKLFLVAEGNRPEREDGFTRPVHGLDCVLETHRGGWADAQLTSATYVNCRTCNRSPNNARYKGFRLGSLRADADGAGLGRNSTVADIDVIITSGEIAAGSKAQG